MRAIACCGRRFLKEISIYPNPARYNINVIVIPDIHKVIAVRTVLCSVVLKFGSSRSIDISTLAPGYILFLYPIED